MSNLRLRPFLHLKLPEVAAPLIRTMTRGLSDIEYAAAGDLIGFSLGHGHGPRYIGGAVSEYQCAFVGIGDGQSCDAAVTHLTPRALSTLTAALPRDLNSGVPARLFHHAFGAPKYEFETIHAADFTLAILYNDYGSWRDIGDIRIFMEPARDKHEAERKIGGLKAIFDFLGKYHDTLNRYRYDLPMPDTLLKAA